MRIMHVPALPRTLRMGITCLAAVLTLIACSQQSAATPTAMAGGTVTARLTGTWPTLDPQLQQSTDSIQLESGLYDWLVYFDGHKLVPYLASNWQQSPTSVKLTLRQDATCADGTPVTTAVVANSFRRMFFASDPRLIATRNRNYGLGPYTVSADDSTVTIGVGQPFPSLLLALSSLTPAAAIICPRGLANSASLATVPDGSGPFKLTALALGDSATATARPEWHWGPNGLSTAAPGFPQTLVYKVITNETTAANLLETGGLDIAVISGPDNARLIADHSLIHKTSHGNFASRLRFIESAGHATADQAVRQALATAIDPKAYGQAAYNGYMIPTTSFLTPDANCFDPATRSLVPTPSVAKAKQIMSAAGYQTGSDGTWQDKNHRPMTILVAGADFQSSGPDYLAAQFTAAGFSVKLSKTDRGNFTQRVVKGDLDVAVDDATSATPDPNGTGTLALFTGPIPPAGTNFIFMDYPDIDAEIAAANASTGAEACKHWAKVQQELLKRYVVIPMGAAQIQFYGRGIQFAPDTYFSANPRSFRRVK